jgi:VacB/RNase II family 3'-5' exoribonuclease
VPSNDHGPHERRAADPETGREPYVVIKPEDSRQRPVAMPRHVARGLAESAQVSLHIEGTADAPSYRLVAEPHAYTRSFVGVVERRPAGLVARADSPFAAWDEARLPADTAAELIGKEVLTTVGADGASGVIADVLDGSGGLEDDYLRIAAEHGVSFEHPPEVMAEARALADKPLEGVFIDKPFITIDNPTSKDLDQAMCLERRADGGYDVHYAIADVAYFIREGSAIDREAQRRGETVYLPDRSLPMLPKELSEGIVSLLPNVRRRAFVVTVSLDAQGRPTGRKLQRGLIESRAKLDYSGVQRYYDGGAAPTTNSAALASLDFLRDIGTARLRLAKSRGVVPNPDTDLEIASGADGTVGFAKERRQASELYNEQISLLVNAEVGEAVAAAGLKGIYRVLDEPAPERLEAFRSRVAELGLPMNGRALDDYINSLDDADPRSLPIRALSTRLNGRAEYDVTPRGHAALKLPYYMHFTAPMRRYADFVAHRVLAALVDGSGAAPYQTPGSLDAIRAGAENAGIRAGSIARQCSRAMLACLLAPLQGATVRGAVLNVRPDGASIRLIEPLADVELRTKDLRALTGQTFILGKSAVELGSAAGRLRIGETVELTVREVDRGRRVVTLEPKLVA